jgi:hypothetical protein
VTVGWVLGWPTATSGLRLGEMPTVTLASLMRILRKLERLGHPSAARDVTQGRASNWRSAAVLLSAGLYSPWIVSASSTPAAVGTPTAVTCSPTVNVAELQSAGNWITARPSSGDWPGLLVPASGSIGC